LHEHQVNDQGVGSPTRQLEVEGFIVGLSHSYLVQEVKPTGTSLTSG